MIEETVDHHLSKLQLEVVTLAFITSDPEAFLLFLVSMYCEFIYLKLKVTKYTSHCYL